MTELNLKYYTGKDKYSDGDIENIILRIVKEKADIHEIFRTTRNWPILYHLSSIRENLLSWYNFDPTSSLLEIGGGCGALTGLFARSVKEVSVVELSKRRAEIIYHRYKEHSNLKILVGNLNDIKFDARFDYVTLIGVLEYAASFTEGPSPFNSFLIKTRSLLKENGVLLLAIENKFGLKYWAGAREDHTGRFFDSIEDYPFSKSIQTFGKAELEEMLLNCGFKDLFFYYPMPDYKLPKVIYSDEYMPRLDDFFDECAPNYDSDRLSLFNENMAMRNLIANMQFDFFANSFLIEAKKR